ncbi:MAG: hypothetical protein RMK20_05730 [Verrucomicrobiales bacterium]|nr:hypothetical protein [Verrucomicrobiales bacterium]
MSVTWILDHVLIPDAADWSEPPRSRERWHTGVAAALYGTEARLTGRDQPWRELSWRITPLDARSRARLVAALRAALVNTRAAAPDWSAAVRIASANGRQLITGSQAADAFAPGQVVALYARGAESVEIGVVAAWQPPMLRLNAAPTLPLNAEDMVMPVRFGRLSLGEGRMLTDAVQQFDLTLLWFPDQPTDFYNPELCAEGEISEQFQFYDLGAVSELAWGCGWNGPARLPPPWERLVAADTFDKDAEGPARLDSGDGWAEPGVIHLGVGFLAWEDAESYPDGPIAAPDAGGGWDGEGLILSPFWSDRRGRFRRLSDWAHLVVHPRQGLGRCDVAEGTFDHDRGVRDFSGAEPGRGQFPPWR